MFFHGEDCAFSAARSPIADLSESLENPGYGRSVLAHPGYSTRTRHGHFDDFGYAVHPGGDDRCAGHRLRQTLAKGSYRVGRKNKWRRHKTVQGLSDIPERSCHYRCRFFVPIADGRRSDRCPQPPVYFPVCNPANASSRMERPFSWNPFTKKISRSLSSMPYRVRTSLRYRSFTDRLNR